jgi:hypothetical protein
VSSVNIPEHYTREQVTEALRALGLDHLENDTEQGLALQEVHMTPDGIRLVILRKSRPFGNESSKVYATIGRAER